MKVNLISCCLWATRLSVPKWHQIALLNVFCAITISAQAQNNISVQGVVRNEQGVVMEGVSVRAKGTAIGTQTDINGAFKLSVPNQETILQFSYINYIKQEIAVGKETQLTVTLSSENNVIDEVVVVGFGQQKRTNLTGSVAVVDKKSLENRPVKNALQALQGLAPGLNISQNNGSLESNPSLNIRGSGTIGQSSSAPLVLIDGAEGSLTALNPQDIETVTVLKDASTASIYGSRAAFGVILVTTKSGQKGSRPVASYNNSLRISTPALTLKTMDSYSFANYFNQAQVNGNGAPHFDQEHLERIKQFQEGKITTSIIPNPTNPTQWDDGYMKGNDNVDYFDLMYKDNSFGQEHNLSLAGGSDKTTYYVSANILDQKGLMAFNTDVYKRYSMSARINSQISSKLNLNYIGRLVREDFKKPTDLNNSFYDNLGRQGWPTLPYKDPNGFLYNSPSPVMGMMEGGDYKTVKDINTQQVQLVFEPIKDWKTYGTATYRITSRFDNTFSNQLYNHDVAGNPILYKNSSYVAEYAYKENYYNINAYTELTRNWNLHNFKGMAGFQIESAAYRDLNASRDGIMIVGQPVIDLTSGTAPDGQPKAPVVSGQYQDWASAGFFSRVNYDYDSKYLLEASMRYDGSSRFRADSRWGFFPSFSAGWNLTKESFMENTKSYIDMIKLRASYGELGNQNTNVWYPTYVVMPVGIASGSWLVNNQRPNTASAAGLVSANLTWETVKTLNMGVDFALLSNRLSGSFDVFQRKTLNMVGPAPQLSNTLGTAVPQANNTDLKTNGFELTLGWRDKTAGNFGYNVKFLLSDYTSTVTRYPNLTGSFNGGYREGQKLGEIWGYETIGIAKSKEEMESHLNSLPNGGQSVIGSQWEAGDIMYKDLNNDGKIDFGSWTESEPGDRKVIGNSTPRYAFGFNMGADYKNFDFSMFLQGVIKRDVWQPGYYFWGATSNIWASTGLTQHMDYFRTADNMFGENLDAYYARPVFGTNKNQEVQTRYLQNAAYIRLKNIQIGYTIDADALNKIGISKGRIYLSGENLWQKSNVATMFDPETIDGGSSGTVYPLTKMWAAGLSLTF
ncbi:SusC/RagA family TonB-linked outer membrane protein [Sphingobacterium anhuiense]|uniref:SusC/RagA family TonB-linked outer membrane protein n=1 Tax=Sphingobacterium anhuiense TaxID=493780 RepID=A0ABW5YX98_9SPHI